MQHPIQQQIIDALDTWGPCDAKTLSERLPGTPVAAIEAALKQLVEAGSIEPSYLQTLPPRTMYRLTSSGSNFDGVPASAD